MISVCTKVLKLQGLERKTFTKCSCCRNIKSSKEKGHLLLAWTPSFPSSFLILLMTCLLQVMQVTCHNCEVVVMFSLKTARCNDKNLQSVPRDLGHDIKVLNFEGNAVTYLGMDYFKEYAALQEVYFANNRIDSIAPDAFRGLRNLQIFYMSNNKLTTFPREAFKHLRYVREVNLKGNPIKYILEDDLKYLPNLEIISFENNWLERIHPKAFVGLQKLEEINLVNNELTSMSSDMEANLPPSLKFFRLYQNPWNCDCKLRWLRGWIAHTKVNWDFGTTIPNTPACSTPEILRGINWKHLEPEKFACASKILTNGSATLEVELGLNVTIDCSIIAGDPPPMVHWMRGQKNILTDDPKYTVSTSAMPDIRSSLTIWKVTPSDVGDYKCVAINSVGASEVTYKLFLPGIDIAEDEKYDLILGIGKEAILGIAVAGAVVILILVICAVYGFRRRDRRKHAYKVRDYKKPAKNKKDKKSKNKHLDMKGERCHPNASTELLAEKKLEQKEMMLNEINEKQNGDFKMKIFSYHDPGARDRSQSEHSFITVEEKETDPLCDKKLKAVSDDSREATPDLLRNDYPKSDSDKQSPNTRDDNSGDEGYRSLNGSGSSKDERDKPKQTDLNASNVSSQSAKSEKSKSEKRVDFADGVTSIDDALSSPAATSRAESPNRPKRDNGFDSATLPSAMKHTSLSKQTSLDSSTLDRPARQNSVDSSLSRDSGVSDRYAPLPSRQQATRNPYVSHTIPRQPQGGASRQSSASSSPSLQRVPHIPSKQNSVTSASSSGSTSPTRAQLQHLLRSYQSSPTRVGKAGPSSPRYSEPAYQNVPQPIKINTKDIPQTYTTKDGRTLVIPPPPPPPQIATRTLGRRLPIPPPPAPPQAGGPSNRMLSPQPPRKPPRTFSSLYDFQTAAGELSDADEVPEPMPKVGEKTEFGTCV